MSAIVAIFNALGETVESYDKLTQDLAAAGAGNPKGRLYHVAATTPQGYLVVDVWESQELLDQFSQTLDQVIEKSGGTPAAPQIYPVHNIMK